MAGLFKIQPEGQSEIECGLGQVVSGNPYVVVSVDWKENEREEIIYSEGKTLTTVVDASAQSVEADIVIAVGGPTLESVQQSVRVLNSAFRNIMGGKIEYKPQGYSDSIISTFYTYLRSGTSRKAPDPAAIPDNVIGEVHIFRVRILPWATSDVDSPTSIASSESMYNQWDRGSKDNTLTISSSSLKGDIAFLSFRLAPTSASQEGLTLAIKKGGSKDRGWFVANLNGGSPKDEADSSGFIEVSNASWVDGFYWETNAAAGDLSWTFPAFADQRKVTPVLVGFVETGSVWDVYYETRLWQNTGGVYTAVESTEPIRITGNSTKTAYIFNEVTWPPIRVPSNIPAISASDEPKNNLGNFLDQSFITLVGSRVSGTGKLRVDYGQFMYTDWIAEFKKSGGSIGIFSTLHFHIDPLTDSWGTSFYNSAGGGIDVFARGSWEKRGMPVRSIFVNSWEDSHITFLSYNNTSKSIGINNGVRIFIDAIFGTIYPFSET